MSALRAVVYAILFAVPCVAAVPATTAFSTAGRVEFSQAGHQTVGNDIFGITAPDHSRQIENTDVGMSVELYAMGQRASWKGSYISVEKFLEPQGDGSVTVTWAFDLKPCGAPAIANLCIEVPPESFDDLPPQPMRRPDADGVFHLDGLFGPVELSVAGSDGQWFFEDFRHAAWSGRFRFRCNVPYTGLAPWKGRVCMNFRGAVEPRVRDLASPAAQKLTDRQRRALRAFLSAKPRNDVDTSTWYPCGLPWGGPGKTLAAGTALDASAVLTSPRNRHVCGAFGRLVGAGDHLEFEKRPGEPVPFWGVNLAANSSSPPKELAPGIVDNLVRQGVNLVRFHKFGGFPGRQMGADGCFLPERQDRMDYFVSLLKQAGIYVYVDWEDGLCFPELAGPWPFKKGVHWAPVFMPSCRDRERAYARALFGHRNPYTGLSYAADPAVACIEILNEVDLCAVLNANPRLALDSAFYAEFDRQWRAWNAARGRSDVKSIADDVGNPDRLRFVTDVQRAYQQAQRAFLRDALGYRGLVTGNNIVQHAYAATAVDDGMDFAGLHGYVGHIPGYVNTPYDNTSAVRTSSPGIPFFGQTWTRPADKPYCFGEWNFCYPNDYRSEGLPFTTAMMAFQGWPMSLFYAFTGPMNWGEWENFHAQGREGIFAHGAGQDPSTWGLTVPCAIAFRRGDIRPSKNVLPVRHTRAELLEMGNPYGMRQMQCSWMFMFGRVYTEIADETDMARWPMKRPEGLSEWDEIRSVARDLGIDGVKEDLLVGDTGELRKFLNPGLFLVDTPRSKFAVGDLSSMGRDGRVLSGVSVRSPETFAALTLTSLDVEPTPVEMARRVLVCLVGNARNEAAVIRGRMIVDPGWEKSRTVLAEPLEATLTFPPAAGPFKVYRLSTRTGERQGELPVSPDGSFTIPKSAHTIYFELVR